MRQVLGEHHADTLKSRHNLAVVLQEQGKWQQAEEMHKEVLEVMRQVLGEHHPDTLSSLTNLSCVLQQRDCNDWKFRFSLDESSHDSRLSDAIAKLRTAIGVQKHRVDDDHPHLLVQSFLLAELLLQMNESSNLQEAEELLQPLVHALRERFGPKHPLTQRATSDLVFLLEDQDRDAEEWRQHLPQIEEEPDSTMTLAEQQYLEEILLGEEWEGSEEVAELLRDLLGKQPRRSRSQILKAAGSSEPSSDRKSASRSRLLDAPAASSSSQSSSNSVPSESCFRPLRSCESSDDGTSSDSSAWLKAALEEKCLEIQEREKQPEIWFPFFSCSLCIYAFNALTMWQLIRLMGPEFSGSFCWCHGRQTPSWVYYCTPAARWKGVSQKVGALGDEQLLHVAVFCCFTVWNSMMTWIFCLPIYHESNMKIHAPVGWITGSFCRSSCAGNLSHGFRW